MEKLSQGIFAAKWNGDFDTYKLGETYSISQIIFANGVLFFTKANKKSLIALHKVLEEFTSFYGLGINQHKNASYVSPRDFDNRPRDEGKRL